MPYYPAQSLILGLTTIRRERRLPRGTYGEVVARLDQRVEAQDVVLRGSLPGTFHILDVLEPLGLRRPEDFVPDQMLQVPIGTVLEKGQVIAASGPGRGARTLKAPEPAVLALVDAGQVILQLKPEPIEIHAMCPGTITSIRGDNSLLLETVGALLQCAWGNDKRAYSAYRMEPEGGIENVSSDGLLSNLRNSALIMTRQIGSAAVFAAAVANEITAIMAPSMRADLRELALRQKIPVLLTDGFGDLPISEVMYNLLRDNIGRPALIDATEPQRWSASRPEIVIPLPSGGGTPPPPEVDQPLAEGVLVRIIRAPNSGLLGRVRRIVEMPRAVENGLRLPGAEVQLSNGRTVFVPQANLELLGRAVDAPGTGAV